MRSFSMAVFAALLFPSVTGADEPPAKSAASASSRVNDQSKRPDSPITKQYSQILADYEAQQVEYRLARVKAEERGQDSRVHRGEEAP